MTNRSVLALLASLALTSCKGETLSGEPVAGGAGNAIDPDVVGFLGGVFGAKSPLGSPVACSGDFTLPTAQPDETWTLASDRSKSLDLLIANGDDRLKMWGQGGWSYNFNFQGSGATGRIYHQRLFSTVKTIVVPGPNNSLVRADPKTADQQWTLTPIAGRPWSFTISSPDKRYTWGVGADAFLTASGPATPMTLAMRTVFDGTWSHPIWAGEAQVSFACDNDGNSAHGGVYVYNTSNAYQFPSEDSLKRIRLGCDTVALAYPNADQTGTPTLISADMDCKNNSKVFRSLKVMRAHDYAVQNKSCPNCNMAGVNLKGLDLSQSKLENVTFTGSDLTGASFAGASLKKAVFAGAKTRLGKADFTGAGLESTTFDKAEVGDANFTKTVFRSSILTNTDLTKANLSDADYELYGKQTPKAPDCSATAQAPDKLCTGLPNDPDLVCATTFRGASLRYTQLPVALWHKVDLRGVKFDWTGGKTEGATLCALKLDDVSFDRASFAGAKFDHANLSRSTFRYADLGFASFVGAIVKASSFAYADLKSANFEEAVGDGSVASVNFFGSIFEVASLKKAGFAGADFSNSSILMPKDPDKRNVKSLQSAKFSNANFNSSDLSGMDLSGGNFDGANMSKTILTDTKLGHSDNRNSTFLGTVFCGARVRRVDITGANLSGSLIPRAPSNQLKSADTGAAVTCDAVALDGGSQIEDVVTTTPAACPDTSSPQGVTCQGDQWKLLGTIDRPVCPVPKPGEFASPKTRSCFACKTNCECATERCINNICAGDCPK